MLVSVCGLSRWYVHKSTSASYLGHVRRHLYALVYTDLSTAPCHQSVARQCGTLAQRWLAADVSHAKTHSTRCLGVHSRPPRQFQYQRASRETHET